MLDIKAYNRNALFQIAEYFLHDANTDVQNFRVENNDNEKALLFDIITNPNNIMDIDGDVVTCKVYIDYVYALYRIQLGKYVDVIEHYNWKSLKQQFFTRMCHNENVSASDPKVDTLVANLNETLNQLSKAKSINGIDERPEPMLAREELVYNEPCVDQDICCEDDCCESAG